MGTGRHHRLLLRVLHLSMLDLAMLMAVMIVVSRHVLLLLLLLLVVVVLLLRVHKGVHVILRQAAMILRWHVGGRQLMELLLLRVVADSR